MKHLIFVALFLVGQVVAPSEPTYKGVYVQQPYVCGAEYATRAYRVAVIGNSLAWSPPQPNFNWAQSNGMAAETLESDYAHITCKALAERHHETVAVLVVQGWALERSVTEGAAWDRTYAEVIGNFAPDALVLQVSDNISPALGDAFGRMYGELLAELKAGRFICLGGWYSNVANLTKTIEGQCVGGSFVPINDIYESSNMRGSSFDSVVNAGVGSHPNDMGHAEIARRIVNAISAER